MGLKRMDGFDNTRIETPYLDVRGIQEFVPMKALAYLVDGKAGISRLDSGFITFYLRDVNANVVIGRMFDVKDFMISGVNISMLKKKPVQISFVAQSFNGSLSLVINSVEVYSGEFDYDRFIGKIECDTTEIECLGRELFGTEWEVPTEWVYATNDSFGKGRVGGFLKVFEIALHTLCGFASILGVDRNELLKTFYLGMQGYYRFLSAQAKVDNLGSLTLYEDLHRICIAYEDDSRILIMDVIKSLSGNGKPLHLVSHLINMAVSSARQAVDLAIAYEMLPTGSKTLVGGVDLLKY